ncbi:OmpA family protein [Cellvibrio japonicus]|uniref:Outer membrane protein A n=1 Tax=Cellvibrio japonicus (strain Ueda107) TaxID=498211 RepID=B3PCH6_CELJU|nr:OmpA family protein [Cellvibrio japonicus]ACE83116.1 outer membrane protein A [Cellvibrio japonicus Ueda107]QEI11879.1 outer membrane beta-barrel protein [Cellvibrio japonicus]QEI15453.1 outer membrane beta-barrel protein [Cellvibrio japonicus]QEI19032.1 outer membrane beta-barrel protein [Cellvibrio japonicus]
MKRLFTVLLCAISTITSYYAAANSREEVETSIYVGIRAGYSYNEGSCSSNHLKCDKSDTGYGLFIGYDINPRWAIETSFNDIGDTTATYSNAHLDGDLSQIDISVKYAYPIYQNLSLYGKVGAAYWDAKAKGQNVSFSDTGVSPLLGAGLELIISEHWKGRIEYQYIDRIGNNLMGKASPNKLGLALIWNFPLRKHKPAKPEPVIVYQPVEAPPPPVEKPVTEQRIVIDENLGGALFEFNKSEIRNTAAIQPVIDVLLEDPSLYVNVIGHTDSKGSEEYNQRLSQTRANVVAKYLNSKGVSLSRIKVFGMGEDQPVADNSTEEGRAQNRRVEFIISNSQQIHGH